ncbi:hypothetical protein [Comamonas kerstersii]|uniref:Uncharacterized protein n=1 Tax=Comamonas kerstersii TaxID=225992 RepID=A0A6A1R1I1_9BURK|nr:hypothetical protein [Comamonas kerstersii]KAB0586168.1 hypothetical protein F7P80_11070 [Comamonas kerstersii]
MPKRKSRNQSLKQRVKTLEMRLGVSKLNSKHSLKMGRTGEIEGFGMAYGALAAGAIECEIAARAADDAELSKS